MPVEECAGGRVLPVEEEESAPVEEESAPVEEEESAPVEESVPVEQVASEER